MDVSAFFYILAIAVVVGVFIGQPFYSHGGLDNSSIERTSDLRRYRTTYLNYLHEQHELDLDYNLGKLSSADYQVMLQELQQKEAALRDNAITSGVVLSEIMDDLDPKVEEMIEKRRMGRSEKSAGFCPKCGKPIQKSDKYCPFCGDEIV